MLNRLILIPSALLVLATPVIAGPCTDRIAELEKSITARHEGAGPALSSPTTTATTGRADQSSNESLRMLQQAKELDRQGKEQECMQIVTAITATVPTGTK